MLKKILFLILILTLMVPLVYAKKKVKYVINQEVLEDHRHLYQHYKVEQPTLPQMVLELGFKNPQYVWGQQKTLKDKLK